jgi:F-type H+-transporting ATPase subunit b
MPTFLVELLQDAHFWVGVAFAILLLVLLRAGVFRTLVGTLDARAAAVQAQLDEATRIREEAQALLADIRAQREDAERQAGEMMAAAQADAKRLAAEAKIKLEEQVKRRGELAERKIATAEAQAAAEVKAAAADLAAQMAEQVLAARLANAKSDPAVDAAIGQLAERLQ